MGVVRALTRRISVKLIVFGIVMSLIPMLILAVIGIRSGERGISIHTAGHLTSVAALKGDQISDWINVQTDGALASLREGVSTPPVQRGERASWWLTASFIDGATGEVTGIPIQSLNAAPPFGDGADFVANSSAEPRLELLGAAGGAAGDLIRVTRPAELRPGESGVLVTDIDAAGLAPLLEPDVGLGPDGRILILNAEGVLLYTGRGIASTLTPPMFRLTEKPGHVHEFQDADGTDLVGKAMEFPGSPWYVVVTLPRSQAFSEVGDLKTSIAIALIVVSLIAIAVSWFVGRSIARPVSRLAEGVRSYTLGERFEALPSGRDEIGELASSFAVLTQSLSASANDLVESNRQLNEANEAQIQFLSTVSHELRTPLTSITAFTDILRRNRGGNLTDKQLEQLNVISRNSSRLDLLISDLLDVSRLEAGTMELDCSTFDVGALISEIADSFGPELVEKGQRLIVEVSPECIWINADRGRVQQVISNIVSNASKYSPSSATIELTARVVAAQLAITVRDEGLGISDEDQAQLFQPFFRSSNEEARLVKGTGLGLVIVKSLIERHGGRIIFSSAIGEGTAFSVYLPGARTTLIEGEEPAVAQPRPPGSLEELRAAVPA